MKLCIFYMVKMSETKQCLIAALLDVQLQEVSDVFSGIRKYYIIDSIDKITDNEQLKLALNEHFNDQPVIAKFGNDSTLKIDDNLLLIFRNIDPDELRKTIFHDETLYTHRFAIRTAEYHTYINLIDKQTNVGDAYGASVAQKGGVIGSIYLRKDDYYEEKYFKGYQKIEAGQLLPILDQGSFSIEFDITDTQYQKAMDYIKHSAEHYKSSWFKAFYSFVPFVPISKNCAEFAEDLFVHIGMDKHYYSYAKIDETDILDKGIFYLFYDEMGFFDSFYRNFDLIKTSIFGDVKLLDKKNTDLHKAIITLDLKTACNLAEVIYNVDEQNLRQESALFLASGLPASEEKYKLIKILVEEGEADVNLHNYNKISTPLGEAVKAGDAWTVNYLIENGADPRFINSNGNSLFDMAASSKSFNILDDLYKYAPDLIYRHNSENHSPAYYAAQHSDQLECGFIDELDSQLIKPYEYYMHPL